MTRVRMDLFASLDGYTPDPADATPDDPMGPDWGRLTAAYVGTRTFRAKIFGDTTGAGTTGVDDRYAAAFFDGIGAEIMGAGMFGLHSFPDDPHWKGWWGERPPFGTPVYVLTHSAPRPSIEMDGGTTFHFRDASPEEVLAEATEAAGGLDVRIGGGYRTAKVFLRAGLVDDLHLMVAPIFLGRGHRLFDDLAGFDADYTVTSEVAESGELHITLTR
ncbi:dihydrofolate reductase family protein [Leifsonia virtsii]|uniref:Dihydrofolate reductase family protein n=1 Tax=Leifsonia virtsii TaxID=3035915 RepID=A0ABT8J1X6_9MICO|nr:dihydrofolate reductase family protein [Leifsonia virtsii]MDN4599090.1 dihydrofolate reductase family protein [Leifsonia virtsii]